MHTGETPMLPENRALTNRWSGALARHSGPFVLMLGGDAGVLEVLFRMRRIRRACRGTVLKLPLTLTQVTLVEDIVMAVMAAVMLAPQQR